MAIRNRVSFRALFVSAANTSIGTSTTLIAFAVIQHSIPCFNASDAFTPRRFDVLQVTNVVPKQMMQTWSKENCTLVVFSPSLDVWVGDERVGHGKS